jgi:uncharacterized protein (TIGR02231 family)
MGDVTFTPHYTLRAVSSGTDSSLKIRYLAKISNSSGEDWKDVSLAISTAEASETTVVPRMKRWTVDFQFTEAVKAITKSRAAGLFGAPQVQQRQAAFLEGQPGWVGGGRPQLESYNEYDFEEDMVTAAAEVSEGITSTFIIPGKQTIRDGENNHTVVIRDLVLEGKFANICVPKNKEVAYLQVMDR